MDQKPESASETAKPDTVPGALLRVVWACLLILQWLLVFAGCLIVANAAANLYMLSTGVEPGTPIFFLDQLSMSPREVALNMCVGVGYIAGPFVLRAGLRRLWGRLRRRST